MPLALSDAQLQTLMIFAADIPPEKRSIFMERIEAMLRVRHRFDDSDVAEISRLAACGLIHRTDAT
jgi:hypothetical protein